MLVDAAEVKKKICGEGGILCLGIISARNENIGETELPSNKFFEGKQEPYIWNFYYL